MQHLSSIDKKRCGLMEQIRMRLIFCVSLLFIFLIIHVIVKNSRQLKCTFNRIAEAMQRQNTALQNHDVLAQANIALRIQRDELRTLNTDLEKANQVRSQFLTTMAHELRTPLTAILGFSQVLLRDMDTSEVRKRTTIERILKNGRHLLDIMNDALDLVKIEAGQMSVRISPVSLPDVINEVTKETQALATTKMLHLQVDIGSDIPEISSDVDMLHQILLNLISNAIKFTEQGEVRISAKKLSGAGITICIQDSGIGIAPEVQERIFDAFYQGDNSITRRYGGTGLGLSIVRHLTHLLGGTVTLESSLGQGSTFTLLLPQESTTSQTKPANVYASEIPMAHAYARS